MSELARLEYELDVLTTRLLLPIRASKEVDDDAVASLLRVVTELGETLDRSGSDCISRKLAGKLWFVFTQMLSEADHTRAPEEILQAAWRYQDRLDWLFGDPSAGSPGLPGVPTF
jgi:hypothetical protein